MVYMMKSRRTAFGYDLNPQYGLSPEEFAQLAIKKDISYDVNQAFNFFKNSFSSTNIQQAFDVLFTAAGQAYSAVYFAVQDGKDQYNSDYADSIAMGTANLKGALEAFKTVFGGYSNLTVSTQNDAKYSTMFDKWIPYIQQNLPIIAQWSTYDKDLAVLNNALSTGALTYDKLQEIGFKVENIPPVVPIPTETVITPQVVAPTPTPNGAAATSQVEIGPSDQAEIVAPTPMPNGVAMTPIVERETVVEKEPAPMGLIAALAVGAVALLALK